MPQPQLQHHHPRQQQSQQLQQQASPELASSPSAVAPPAQSQCSPPRLNHQTNSQQQPAQRTNNSSEGRKISCEDIQLVQNLIERCLQLYMNRKEVVQTLQTQAKVEPGFTSLVWLKLEEQNPDFFKAYYTRLKLKTQIATFNQLLDQQFELMQKMGLLPTAPRMYHSPVSQMMPANHSQSAGTTSHLGPMSSNTNSREGALRESLQPSACNGTSDIGLSAPSVGEINSTAGVHAEVLFPFGHPPELSGMGMGTLDGSFVHHDQQSQNCIEGLTTAGDSINTRDSLSSLGHLPRNFSLSDLTAELGPNSRFPRNFSLSDLTADLGPGGKPIGTEFETCIMLTEYLAILSVLDFGPLGSFSSPFLTSESEAFLRSPERDGFDDEAMLEFVD